jgi:cell division septation protein DedD
MAMNNRRAFELKLGRLGITLLISGMSLFMFGIFLFGIVVGKHLDAYPEKYSGGFLSLARDRLSWMVPGEEEMPQSEPAAPGDQGAEEEAFDFTFYKTLGDKKDKKKSVVGSGIPESGSAGKALVEKQRDAPEAPVSLNDASRNRTLTGSAADKTVKEKPVSPAPAAPAHADAETQQGFFEVQAAAYRDVAQARKIMNDLKQMGFKPRIVQKDIPKKGRWFRVIAGDFADRKDADIASLKITRKINGVKCIIRYNRAKVDGL